MRRAAAVLLVLVAACSGGDDPEPQAQLELAPSTSTTASPLAGELPDELPGFGAADPVALDLAAAADASADPAEERRRLTDAGFRHGISRSWADPAGDTAYLAVYELDDPAAYDATQRAALEAIDARPFEVPGGIGFTTVEEGLTTHAVLLVQEDRWILALVASEEGRRQPEEAVALAALVGR